MVSLDTRGHLNDNLDEELLYLKRRRLFYFIIVSFIFGWLWFPYFMFQEWPIGQNIIPSILLIFSASFCLTLYSISIRFYYLDCIILLLGMLAAIGFILRAHPESNVLVFGVAIIIAADALLGARQALIASLLLWAMDIIAQHPGRLQLDNNALELLFLNGTVFLFVALNSRSLTVAVEWALTGWAKASEALNEARAHRAELHRVVRALEEATYRIERMNRELAMAQHQAEAERDSKARFAAIVSHELRGPLSLILGFSKMMVMSPERYKGTLPPSYRADLVTVYQNSQHLVSLVSDVLDLSRMGADRLSLVREQIDLERDVVAICLNSVKPWAKRKGIYLQCAINGKLPPMIADKVRLRQVLLNLLTNAIRFTESGGVTVSADTREDCIIISVRDTGSGIPAHDLPYVSIADGTHVVDCSGKTLIPGLIDAHVHLTFSGDQDVQQTRRILEAETAESLTIRVLSNAQQALKAGITTLRDCGGRGLTTLGVRDAIHAGLAVGPRILASGMPITTTAGHLHWCGLRADGEDGVCRATREMVQAGADFIKMMATGGYMTPGSNPRMPQYTVKEMAIIVEEAHRLGRHVGAHVLSAEGVRRTLQASVDTLEHCMWHKPGSGDEYDLDAVAYIVKAGRYVTLARGVATLDSDASLAKARESYAPWRDMVARGVRMILATDAGIPSAPRFDLLPQVVISAVSLLDMTPMEAIAACTRIPAEALGMGGEIGTLEPGKRADIVVLDANPLENIRNLRAVNSVFMAGMRVA